MEIWVNIHTYNTYGGNSSLGLVGQFFGLNLPDFGDAVKELDIHVYFHNCGEPAATLESMQSRYATFIQSLPTSKYYRKKGKLEISYVSRIGDASVVSGYGPPKLELFVQGAREIVDELSVVRNKLKRSDSFRVDDFFSEIQARLVRLPKTIQEFDQLRKEVEVARLKRNEAMSEWDKLGIEDWDEYHPRAREILDDVFYWDCANDFSPNGNDTGADVLEFYKEWRKKNKKNSALGFFQNLMRDWDVVIPPPDGDDFSTTTHGESIVGLAFSQLKIDGVCEEQVSQLALDSLSRQRQRTIQLHSDWDLFEERMKAFELVESKLKLGTNQIAGGC